MNRMLTVLILTAFFAPRPDMTEAANKHYPTNRAPLAESSYVSLPVGAVKAEGWLHDQLTITANGLTGHLDEFWPSVAKTAWKGGEGEAWERGPYYLDGLVPLAYILDDARLKDKVKSWIEPILASQRDNGWFGPKQNNDRWPLAVAMKVLTQYQEATGDERVVPLLSNYFKYLANSPPDWPDHDWRGMRAMENVVTAYWLYRRTGDPEILDVAHSIYMNSFDWTGYFLDFPYPTEVLESGIRYGHPSHVVNIAMGIKHPGVWSMQSGNTLDVKAVYEGLKSLDAHHGQVTGRFSGDEHLSGRRPTQGTEHCAVVEFMFSLEHLVESLGDVAFADRLELLAYNANPGTCTPDYWAHQYDQQANQVWCSVSRREWSTNSETSNLYGLEPHYGCCLANMHQGWPKFVSHMWMATQDNGLAAIAYGPNRVTAKVADGTEVTISQKTEYPFDGRITMTVDTPKSMRFPLHLRIPSWASGATVQCGGTDYTTYASKFTIVDRTWNKGDTVEINLPMKVRTETRYKKAIAIMRGPLYFSLKIGEKFIELARHSEKFPAIDYEVRATTPWNYALIINRHDPEPYVEVETRPVSKVPFANDAAPVTLKVKGRQLPDWGMSKDSAADPPVSPTPSAEPVTELELIPYGNTRLRITEFPTIKQD